MRSGFAQLSLVEAAGPAGDSSPRRRSSRRSASITLGEPTPAMKAVIDAARQAVEKTM